MIGDVYVLSGIMPDNRAYCLRGASCCSLRLTGHAKASHEWSGQTGGSTLFVYIPLMAAGAVAATIQYEKDIDFRRDAAGHDSGPGTGDGSGT